MKAAVVHAAGQSPVWDDLTAPQAGEGELLVDIAASALSPLTRMRASGSHYSSSGRYPFVAGVDGTGRTQDGRRVYFVLPRAPFGGIAQQCVVGQGQCFDLPEGLDPAMAAAIANPGMSSWAALSERACFAPGESVLVHGATGASGRLAVQIARHRGASRVIATGRNRDVLAGLGADVAIPLVDDGEALEAAFREECARGVDVVLDYLWGPSAERLLIAAAKASPAAMPVRFVQIGTASGADIRLPGAILRSSGLHLMGSGIGSVPLPRLIAAIGGVFEAAAKAALTLPFETMPMAQVARAWAAPGDRRIVLIRD